MRDGVERGSVMPRDWSISSLSIGVELRKFALDLGAHRDDTRRRPSFGVVADLLGQRPGAVEIVLVDIGIT
jgi:hypothetical protein